ncbi:hypothetical protein LR004_01270, partial [Candidatus Gracilibacteria bacterium]|nr:hypothetical protein [Candidatus Gracilibacteria bacterium]
MAEKPIIPDEGDRYTPDTIKKANENNLASIEGTLEYTIENNDSPLQILKILLQKNKVANPDKVISRQHIVKQYNNTVESGKTPQIITGGEVAYLSLNSDGIHVLMIKGKGEYGKIIS